MSEYEEIWKCIKDFMHCLIFDTRLSIMSPYFYIALLPIVIVYYTLARRAHLQWAWLLMASVVFYFSNGRRVSFLLAVPMAVTYLAALLLDKVICKNVTIFIRYNDNGDGYSNDGNKTCKHDKEISVQIDCFMQKLLAAAAVIFNAAFLMYYKEYDFFIRAANAVFRLSGAAELARVPRASPFGLSYISLMLISYLLDVYWGTVKAQHNPLKFLAYVLFFPITASGPIARYIEMKGTLFEDHKFQYNEFCFGVQRIVWGFFKKLVIAERVALLVNGIYGSEDAAGFYLLTGLMLWSVQVYFDFSGCMDMMIGAAQMLGIRLPENFNHPLQSVSLSEWWRRWHITLGLWVKDYVLYPVLKSRAIQGLSSYLKAQWGRKNRYAKLIPVWCGMFCVWFTVGFWHGGSWKYIFGSGLFFFFMIAGGQALEPVFQAVIRVLHIRTDTYSWKLFLRLRTAFLFAASVSYDRALSLKKGVKLWRRVFKEFNPQIFFDGTLFKCGLDIVQFTVLVFALTAAILAAVYGQKENIRQAVSRQNIALRWTAYIALSFAVIIFGMYGYGFNPQDFIYGGF